MKKTSDNRQQNYPLAKIAKHAKETDKITELCGLSDLRERNKQPQQIWPLAKIAKHAKEKDKITEPLRS